MPAVLTHASRRLFLRRAACLGAVAGPAAPWLLPLMSSGAALAQSAGDYRAIVCVFLGGGNDTYNTVLATDADSWSVYSTLRNQAPDSIALLAPGTEAVPAAAAASPARLGGVLPLNPARNQGRGFALHPVMGTLQQMFDADRRLAIVSNVGPLIVPTSKAQLGQASHPRPAALGSHNDQTYAWQAFAAEGALRGWGGRMGDMLAAANAQPIFTAVSTGGNAVFLSGDTVRTYQVGSAGATRPGLDSAGRLYGNVAVGEALNRIITGTRGTHVFEADVAAVSQRTVQAEAALRTALRAPSDAAFGTAPASGAYNANNDPKLQYPNPLNNNANTFNPLAQQLQIVARMIDACASGSLGVRRQVFAVNLGGFDTHDTQNRGHADLLARLAHALRYFDTTLGALGLRNSVTTFTASEFGRTFTSNGDGTDHGWGAHHFVMGGAVKGGDLYGRFPTLAAKNSNNNNFDASPDQLGSGSLLPQVSVDQLGATLARWFGLGESQLASVFPNLGNFDASVRDLGFMT